MNLTDKQKRAVYADNKNILVSAAAGSGKTSVLSMRISRLVSEGADIRRMLVCTFTNLAAAEMKERIARRLSDIAEETGSLRMRAQAEYASSADICTIHSFCLKLVRENHLNLGLPNLRIASEQLQKTLFSQAMEDTFDELSAAEDESFLRLAKRYVNKSERGFKELLSEVYNFAMTMEDGVEWIKKLDGDSAFERLGILYKDKLLRDVRRTAAYYEACVRISEKNGWEKQLENDAAEYEAARGLLDVMESEEAFLAAAAKVKTIKRQKGLEPESEVKIHEGYKKKARASFKALSYFGGEAARAVMDEEKYMIAQAGDIYAVLRAFDENYSRLKLEKGAATFDDILRYAYKALENDSLAESWRERYDHIFVDEYQDTNPVQDAIIARVSRADNRFMVGDIKQSIYRFRLADPLIFRKKQEEYEGKTSGVELIRMNDNFRSSRGVTEKINLSMRKLMSRDFGEVDYTGGEELIAGSDADGFSELILTHAGECDPHEADAETVAKRIEELHREGADYSDIAVLLASANVQGAVYKKAMERRGIPCDSVRDKLNTDEAELFVNLLRVIDGGNSDIALLAVMRSHIGGFNEAELAEIRASDLDASFYEAAESFADGVTGEKCVSFFENIDYLRVCEKGMELGEFLIFLKNKTLFGEMVRVLPGGERRLEDFERFFDECLTEAASRESLFDLIMYYDELKRQGEPYMTAKSGGNMRENSVHIMTVHASKGLEFPIVFFSCLHKGINKRGIYTKSILYNAKLGIVTDIYDESSRVKIKSLLKETMKDISVAEGKSEFLRLCYVAMTRAKKALILTGAAKDSKGFLSQCGYLTKELVSLNDDPLTWFTWAFMREDGTFDVNFRTEKYETGKEADLTYAAAEKILSEAAGLNTNGFCAAAEERRPLKIGVSSLLPEYSSEEMGARQTHFEKRGPQFGTLIHLFMEHADFARFEGVENQTNRMKNALLITQREAELIRSFKANIDAFMRGETAARIARAKKVMREVPFNISINAEEVGMAGGGSVLVQGIMDMLIFEDDGIVIVDYKSNYADEGSIPALTRRYGLQMRLYRRAVELITKEPVKECLLCFLRAGRTVGVS